MEDNVQGVDHAWNVSQEAEQYVDEDVGTAAAAEEHGDGWEADCKDDD